ncbi:MAG: hypothetical protein R2861_10745 [Desulfobacterales bacterium]
MPNASGENRLAAHFHDDAKTLCAGCHHHSPVSLTPPACASCHKHVRSLIRPRSTDAPV